MTPEILKSPLLKTYPSETAPHPTRHPPSVCITPAVRVKHTKLWHLNPRGTTPPHKQNIHLGMGGTRQIQD
jgi:hypothetical protein